MRPSRSARYLATGTGIAVWAAGIVWLAVALHPVDHYLVSYYLADYRFGFIRRGLAGELFGPGDDAAFFGRAGAACQRKRPGVSTGKASASPGTVVARASRLRAPSGQSR